jgi:hypothetical protein
LAGETGLTGGSAEFPVFKASEGAFDRAKYEEQAKARVTTDGVNVTLTGKEIDEDLKKKKVSAEDAIKKANNFYNESYDRNLKELAPAIERGGVYYDNAYSGAQSDKSQIKRRIDKGEALDGKEIFEMSKDAAKNKIGNIETLKKGKVTEIVENLGFKTIKEFDVYEDVKEDFDSKIKDDKLKFEPLLTKISSLLSYFNDDSPMASQNYSKLYTPENNAILSALAKILNEEGFESESVVNMSKRYKENLGILAEKTAPLESKKMDKEGNIVSATGGTGATGTTSEQKLEEKKQEKTTGDNKGSTGGTSTSPTGKAEESKIESATSTASTNIASNSPTTGTAASSSVETLNKKSDAVSTEGAGTEKKEETKNNEAKKEGTKESKVEGADSAYDKLLSEMNLNKSKEGEKEVKDKGKEGAKSEASKEGLKSEKEESKSKKDEKAGSGDKSEKIESSDPYDKLLSELGLGFLNKGKGTSDNKDSGKSDKTPIKETKESKIEEKSTTPSKSVETSSTSTPIKETQAQNLSSVSTPEPDKNKTENTQTPASSTASSTTQTPMSSVSTTSTTEETKTISESQSEANKKSEEKKSKEESDSMNKEMSDNIKTMVNLLTQLNSTLQNPLVVIPNKKNFV